MTMALTARRWRVRKARSPRAPDWLACPSVGTLDATTRSGSVDQHARTRARTRRDGQLGTAALVAAAVDWHSARQASCRIRLSKAGAVDSLVFGSFYIGMRRSWVSIRSESGDEGEVPAARSEHRREDVLATRGLQGGDFTCSRMTSWTA